ncbi:39S ribosomal protein L13, mitochondrial [Portunus trituberculatus]|uniref:39S ribosomal protein L13, mitochondrial n=1 Tax=Portunus trituberculatus TaxID=210409 RepID=A0A5B7IAP9_PORTR|nr:39S ribosomal protein L13, mitochondrial [Portunus trituberculatus]
MTPTDDSGDHVVVINSRDIAFPGDEWEKRVYFHHTGYAGGATWTLAWQLHEADPTMVRMAYPLHTECHYHLC